MPAGFKTLMSVHEPSLCMSGPLSIAPSVPHRDFRRPDQGKQTGNNGLGKGRRIARK
jgi:hypothetical protein